jgi:hypothetical protein
LALGKVSGALTVLVISNETIINAMKLQPNNPINTGVYKRRFSLLSRAGYGEH